MPQIFSRHYFSLIPDANVQLEPSIRAEHEVLLAELHRNRGIGAGLQVATPQQIKQHDLGLHESESVPDANPWSQTKWDVGGRGNLPVQESFRLKLERVREVHGVALKRERKEPDTSAWFDRDRFHARRRWWKLELFNADTIQERRYGIESQRLVQHGLHVLHAFDGFVCGLSICFPNDLLDFRPQFRLNFRHHADLMSNEADEAGGRVVAGQEEDERLVGHFVDGQSSGIFIPRLHHQLYHVGTIDALFWNN